MKKQRTIGIIGLGSIGDRHARNLVAMGHDVKAHDPDSRKYSFAIPQFDGEGKISYHDTLDSIVSGIDGIPNSLFKSDAIIIASPTSLHTEHILQFKGKPLFVEKPIADKLPVDISSVVMVGYNLRFHSCVKKAKEWMDNGMIGRPLWANFTLGQYSEKPPYLRDGVILNWSHEIDLALYLLGPWSISGSATRISDGRDDLTDILLNQSGCRTCIHLDYLTKPEVRQSIIVGDEATIIMDLVHRVAWLRGKDDVMLDMHEGKDSWNDNYIEEMQEFLGILDDPDIPRIGATGAEGLEVLKVCSEVRKQAGL